LLDLVLSVEDNAKGTISNGFDDIISLHRDELMLCALFYLIKSCDRMNE